jgi:hypothetical protein
MAIDGFHISGQEDSEVTLNGLLISNGTVRVDGKLRKLRILHCTMVPGLSLSSRGEPRYPTVPSLVVECASTTIEIEDSIIGGMRTRRETHVHIRNTIVDATGESNVAYAALDGYEAGGALCVENCTVIGKVHTVLMEFASNSIFLAKRGHADTWAAPVLVDRLQVGCVRYCYLPPDSRAPHRYRCQPEAAVRETALRPHFTSRCYGRPGYCQLSRSCAKEILQGADDESEMGAFHDLYQPQREGNLRAILGDYVRVGFEAGILYADSAET